MHEVCEKESLLDGIDYEPEYYDDEELDAYRHRAADSYTPAEIEQFEEVLTTMRAEEVAGWVRSLRLRGVALPDALCDEEWAWTIKYLKEIRRMEKKSNE